MESKQKTIFVVDDNAVNLTVAHGVLSKHYTLLAATSGAVMFEILERNQPDLILLDVEMPEMDGFEVITLLKSTEKTAHIPVIFLTSKTDGESILKGFSLGAVDYIDKPFVPDYLIGRIEHFIL